MYTAIAMLTFSHSILEKYLGAMRRPRYNGVAVYKLEMIQRRSDRYVTNRYHNASSVETMLQKTTMANTRGEKKESQINPPI